MLKSLIITGLAVFNAAVMVFTASTGTVLAKESDYDWISLSGYEDYINGTLRETQQASQPGPIVSLDEFNETYSAENLSKDDHDFIEPTKMMPLSDFNKQYSLDEVLAPAGISAEHSQQAEMADHSTHRITFRTSIQGGRPGYVYDQVRVATLNCDKSPCHVTADFSQDRLQFTYEWENGETSTVVYLVE